MDKSRYTIEYINPDPIVVKSSPVRSILFFLLGGLVAFLASIIAYSFLSKVSLVNIITSPQDVVATIGNQGDARSESSNELSSAKAELAKVKKEHSKLVQTLKDQKLNQEKNKQKVLAESLDSNNKTKELSQKIQILEQTSKSLLQENKKLNKTANSLLLENKKVTQSAKSLMSKNQKSKQKISALLIENKQATNKIRSLESTLKKEQQEKGSLLAEATKTKNKIDQLALDNQTITKKTANLSEKNTLFNTEIKQLLESNNALKKNLDELSTQLQKEKESNASLLYQLSLQKTENVRLLKTFRKNLLSDNVKSSSRADVVKIIDKKSLEANTSLIEKTKIEAVKELPLEKVNQRQKSNIDDIMAAMVNVNTSPPASLETQRKKDFVVEVKSGDSAEDLQKVFQEQLDELTQ